MKPARRGSLPAGLIDSVLFLASRRTVAVETSLAMVLALCLAPFQHFHSSPDHPAHAKRGEIHAHWFPVRTHSHQHPGSHQLKADDDDHADAHSIDTYTILSPGHLFLLPPSSASPLKPVLLQAGQTTPFVEERAHDPPGLDHSSPRAPPI